MQSREEETAFFEKHRDALLAAAMDGGVPAAYVFVQGFDGEERLVLYVRAGDVLAQPSGPGLDALIEFADLGIAEMRRRIDGAEDEAERERWTRGAHRISFLLAEHLADCRPEDELPRRAAHFRRGVRAAEDCISWCPPDDDARLSRDHWALGVHQIALGEVEEALLSWERGLTLAIRFVAARGLDTAVNPSGQYPVMLLSGLVGVAKLILGDADGTAQWLAAITSFGHQLDDPKKAGAASNAIGQMEQIRKKYGREEYATGHYEEE